MTTQDQTATLKPTKIEKQFCESARIAKQAEVTAGIQPTLDGYRTSFESARTGYTAAWSAAQAGAEIVTQQVNGVIADLKKRLGTTVTKAVEDVWSPVASDLSAYVGLSEQPPQPETFDDTPRGKWASDVATQVAELQTQADHLSDTFTRLLAEITALPARLSSIQTDVTALTTDVASTAASAADVDRDVEYYVRALISQWRLNDLYHGITGNSAVSDYTKWLRVALQNVLDVWAVIVDLSGEQAYRTCREKKYDDLGTTLVNNVIERYWDSQSNTPAGAQ